MLCENNTDVLVSDGNLLNKFTWPQEKVGSFKLCLFGAKMNNAFRPFKHLYCNLFTKNVTCKAILRATEEGTCYRSVRSPALSGGLKHPCQLNQTSLKFCMNANNQYTKWLNMQCTFIAFFFIMHHFHLVFDWHKLNCADKFVINTSSKVLPFFSPGLKGNGNVVSVAP